MLHQMDLFVHSLYQGILDTTKTYLQEAYNQYALHICPCKDIPDMGYAYDMPTGMHLWKTYHRNGLSRKLHDNC